MPPVKTTIPFVDMFVGLGSASHYLKEWFHPVAAFDSDSDAREGFTKFFPEAVVTADLNNMLLARTIAKSEAISREKQGLCSVLTHLGCP